MLNFDGNPEETENKESAFSGADEIQSEPSAAQDTSAPVTGASFEEPLTDVYSNAPQDRPTPTSTVPPYYAPQGGAPYAAPSSASTPPAYTPYNAGNSARGYGSTPYTAQPARLSQQPTPQQPQYGFGTPLPPQKPPKKSSAGKKVFTILLVLVLLGAAMGIGTVIGKRDRSRAETATAAGTDQVIESTTSAVSLEVESTKSKNNELSATDIAEAVRPCVVGVMSYAGGTLAGEGSGVILCETGGFTYIITCAHVISESNLEFEVMVLDGTTYDATLVGYDERTDIGVLKIDATGLPVATFGDSSTLKIGETVYAIGNPGGSEYFGSMTDGIVSSIDRSIASTYTMTVIQHNAAINPGNSGGALVNTAGQVIGINSSKIADTDYEGMGFAVPMSIAKDVAESLISYGYVPNRPMLGIQYSDVSAYQFYSMLVRIKGLPQGSLIIAAISEGSDLANTDVKVGDLITAVNGVDLDTSDVLLDLIDSAKVGDTLTLSICRVDSKSYETKDFEVNVKLVEDKGTTDYGEEETTTSAYDYGYGYGGGESFEDFFRQYFGF